MKLKQTGLPLMALSVLLLSGCQHDKPNANPNNVQPNPNQPNPNKPNVNPNNTQPDPNQSNTNPNPNPNPSNVQTSDVSILENKFHLLHDDAVYVTQHHKQQAKYVASLAEPMFTNVKFNFKVTPVPPAMGRVLANPSPWTPQAKLNVQRMLGQIAFVINTQEFENRFNNAGLEKMEQSAFASGIGDAKIKPVNYQAFKDVVNDMTAKWEVNNNTYTFSAYGSVTGGNAYGAVGQPNVYLSLTGMSDISTLHHSASLLLHELTHTFGYSHDGFNDMTPNNIPYYVQAITWDDGMNEVDCDQYMNLWQQGTSIWGQHCNLQGSDKDPSTQNPPLTSADGRNYRDINLFARFFGDSDVTNR
ncbi:hypothetical protein ACFFUO_06440 [Vibrio artabrorum]|uniref:Uncharacterized protein n=1 Tax=Vibrio artabrorum TaxID=446374 RepID=A0ABT8CG82_9VIBR|nr:hypothetical protein [Vibrio artabrorum]MDN3700716.1 hypothetical protein [Vibrio artabrorum]